MRRMGRNFGGVVAAAVVVLLMAMHTGKALAQGEATIHGHVQNPAGQPITKGDVRLTTDRSSDAKSRKYQYTFPLDANGDYKGAGIAPGSYVALVYVDDKSIDFIDPLDLKTGDDKVVSFDMTRKEYIDKMTPEEKKQLESSRRRTPT